MSLIISINAREILDSRGNPTLEVDVLCDDGTLGRAAVPSGASTGKHEVLELRDADKRRYLGNGVLKAVKNINNIISRSIVGMDVTSQSGIDNMMLDMDGTKNKSKLGANAILGVSLSIAVAAANSLGIPLYRYIGGAFANTLPVPLMNIINGGAHADNNLDFQEFMIVPFGFDSFRDSIRAGVETFHNLKSLLKSKGYSTTVGDEGGFAPNLKSNEEALELISKAIEKSGYKIGKNISLALDVASSEFFNKGKYKLQGNNMSTDKLISIYQEYINKYHIVSIEDPLSEDDWDGWKNITDALGNKVQIVGDDLFVTNTQRLKRGIDGGIANSILIKVNQIGTLTETIEAIEMAKMAGYTYIISHRSGETEDSFISDLAVATNSGQIKTGSASRSDRLAKYNQLLRIEEELGKSSIFKGKGLYKIN